MKRLLLLFLISFGAFAANDVNAQCANNGSLVAGSLTPPGVGLSTTQTYASGQYMLAFVTAGANYTVTTCGTSAYDTQLTVYEDATGAYLAYNDDNCGLQSTTSFTANTCGYVRVTLHQYSCNSSGLSTPVIMTQNTAGSTPSITSPAADAVTCAGVPVSIGNAAPATGGTTPYTYAWLSATGLSSTTTPTTNATISTSATYTLTVTDANNCAVTDEVAIAINPPPTIALGADTAHCDGTTLILDAGNPGSSYVWNDLSAAQTLTTSASGTYYVTVTTPAGCVGTDSINITLNPLPVVNLGADSIQCGGFILLDAGNAGAAYVWNDSTMAQTLPVTATGTYSVTVTSPAGCVNTDNVNISIDPLPVIALGTDTVQCAGTVMLDAGNAGASFLWNDSTTAQTFTADSSGTYYVTVTNSFSCSATDSISITINALPVVMLGTDTVQCSGTVMLDAGNAGFNYVWNDSTTAQIFIADSTGTYAVTVTNPVTGCMAADTIMVTINALPVVTLGADSTQCSGTIMLDAMNTGSSYLWNDGTTTQTVVITSTGMYYVEVTNPDGCSSSDSVNITINALPVVDLGTDTAQCGGSITLDAGNPGMNYMWYNSTTSQTLTVFMTDTISVMVTNPVTGCMAGDMAVVTIAQFPVVDLGADTTQCAGIVTLDAGNTGALFVWSDASGLQTLPVSTSGSYYVSVTNNGGCTSSDTIDVTINALPLVGLLPFTNPECVQTATFGLTGGSPAGGIYSGTGVSGNMFSPSATGVGTFTITYTIVDGSTGCDNSSSQNLTILDCTGITENELANEISIYPNPANGMVSLSIGNPDFSELQISVIDMQGKEIYSSQENDITTNYTKQIDLSGFAKGVYYIKLSTDASVAIKKLIVQ